MITIHRYKDLDWVDVESPTPEEVRKLIDAYDIRPNVAEELLLPSLKTRAEFYDDFIYFILYFPVIKNHYSKNQNQEIDFIIGKKFIITTRYDLIDSVRDFSKALEITATLEKEHEINHAGFIFYFLMKKLYKTMSDEVEYISSRMRNIEDGIFKGKEKEMVMEISEMGRILLDFKQAIEPQKDVLAILGKCMQKLFDEKFARHIKDIISEYQRISGGIEKNREILAELRETNNSLLSTKQNEIMKILTIVSFIAYPLTILSALFQMNMKHTPIIGMQNDFWIVTGSMFIVAVLFFLYFKFKKWL